MSALSTPITTPQYWMAVAWPAFLAACLLEGLVFAVVDPAQLHWPSYLMESSRQATYTLVFFSFWLITTGCSGLAVWLTIPKNAKQ